MKTSKHLALLNFTNASDEKVKNVGQSVAAKLAKNPNFPQPTVDIASFLIKVETYVSSIVPKTKSSSDSAAIKNQNKKIVQADLVLLRNYVNAVANGDRVILLTSGFDITPETKLKPAQNSIPLNVVVKPGGFQGTALLSCAAQKSAVIYEVRAKHGEENWSEPVGSTKSTKILIKGLVPGKSYEFQMRTMGSTVYSEWSSSILMIVV
jgi:hypothetical protein